MRGHHRLGRSFRSGDGGLRSFLGHLHDHSHPSDAPRHVGPHKEDEELACIAAYTGVTEDEIEEKVREVDRLDGAAERAMAAHLLLRVIENTEVKHRLGQRKRRPRRKTAA